MKRTFTKTVLMHYFKLVFRSALFLTATGIYVYNRIRGNDDTFSSVEKEHAILIGIWVFFFVGMVMRLFPAGLESMGCQKQFRKNYLEAPGCHEITVKRKSKGVFLTFSSWILLNGAIGGLYIAGVIDKGILFLISLAYSVCDVICILFFCPFQTWFMKNKCCTTCRIYNWDYAMMFTPLVFIPNVYTWTLLGMALVLLVRWEYVFFRYPERFSEKCNRSLSCAMCKEKLCLHKKQLQGFLMKGRFDLSGNAIIKTIRGKRKKE